MAFPGAPSPSMNSTGAMAGPDPTKAALAAFFPFFTPSFELAFLGAIAVTAITGVHGYLAYRTRAGYFFLIMQAAIFYAVGMTLRFIIVLMPSIGGTAFTVQTLLLQIPGSIIAIEVIFSYTRMIWWLTPNERLNITTLWTPPRATSLTIAIMSTAGDVMNTAGQFVPMFPQLSSLGLVIMFLAWLYFAIVVIRFTFTRRRWRLPDGVEVEDEDAFGFGLALSGSAILLCVRGVYLILMKNATHRLTIGEKPTSLIVLSEYPMWLFDILPSFLILFILAVYHPGFYLPKRLTAFRLKTKQLVADRRLNEMNDAWVLTVSSPTPISANIRDKEPTAQIATVL